MSQKETSPLKTIAKGAGIFFFGMIISKIILFFFRVFVARYFGPADYGLFTIGLAVIGFAGVFAVLGLPTGVTRYVSYHRARGNEAKVKGTVTSSLYITLAASLVVFFILFFLAESLANSVFNEPMLTGVIQIMSLAIPFNSMFMMLAASFEGFKRVKYRVYTENIFANTTKLFLVIVLGLLGYGVFGIALSHTVAMVLTFFLAFYFLERKLYPALKPKIKPVLMGRELIAFSAPLLFAGFMSTIIMWTDTLMLGYFGSAANVGIYNVALNTAWFLFLLPAALATLFLPVITELHAKGKSKDLESVYKTVTKWIFYFDFPLLLLFMLFPGQILNVIFGSEFVLGYAALGILSLGFFVYNINQTSHHVLSMLKRTDCIFYSTAVCAAVNVVLNFILIPVLGISGAAVASAVTYVVLGALLAVFAWKFAETVPFSKSWIRSFAVGLVSVALITILGRAVFRTFDIYILALLFVLFVLLYAFLLLVSGGVEKEDVEILCTIERKTRLRSERLRSFIKKFVRY